MPSKFILHYLNVELCRIFNEFQSPPPKAEIGYRVADRLYDIKREMDTVVDLGCGRGYVSRHISPEWVKNLVLTDHCPQWVESAAVDPEMPTGRVSRLTLCEDKSEWPFADDSVSCFLSSLSLHWVNDLPRCLRNVQRSLKPDGVFICSVFGGETLYELRASLQLAETEREGGFAAHVSPFVRVEDLAGLLNRAGFTMLTLDSDEMTVRYPSLFEVMRDLQGTVIISVDYCPDRFINDALRQRFLVHLEQIQATKS
jgi:NADH dehydrogenase [ubiquinone] 1 alpha subcomplex assembly factor 5